MADPVGSVTQSQPVVPVADMPTRATQDREPPVPVDTVQLSSAAQKALQEATETQAQTAKEAGKGDMQAKRLLAKEANTKEVEAQDDAAKELVAKDNASSTKHVVA